MSKQRIEEDGNCPVSTVQDEQESALVRHAQRELPLVLGDDEMDRMMRDNVMELIRVFSSQGHSGFSAPYCLSLFDRLARFEPVAPLTGADDEWRQPDPNDPSVQNRRDGSVFRDKDGRAYWLDAYVFRDRGDQGTWVNGYSRKYIRFPHSPQKPKLVLRPSLTYAAIVLVRKLNNWLGTSFSV